MRAATAGTVAPSHLLLKFGKLTIKFETLCQFQKGEIQPSAAYGKAVHSRPLLTFGKLTTKFEILSQFRKVEIRHPFAAAYGKAVPSRLSHLGSVS